jgi:hypothetical protein
MFWDGYGSEMIMGISVRPATNMHIFPYALVQMCRVQLIIGRAARLLFIPIFLSGRVTSGDLSPTYKFSASLHPCAANTQQTLIPVRTHRREWDIFVHMCARQKTENTHALLKSTGRRGALLISRVNKQNADLVLKEAEIFHMCTLKFLRLTMRQNFHSDLYFCLLPFRVVDILFLLKYTWHFYFLSILSPWWPQKFPVSCYVSHEDFSVCILASSN